MSNHGILTSARFKWVNWYPPLLGAGIRVLHHAGDAYTIKVKMPLTRFNLNAVGTHFGGSLYAMCDPWFMLILMQHLGRDYIVWDKAAVIQFVKPGKGTVYATFHIPPETIAAIKAQADAGEKLEPVFNVNVVDGTGEVVATVEKRLYVRKK
jgi:acyl-coenzyme A thioesterase PaaI-like protein